MVITTTSWVRPDSWTPGNSDAGQLGQQRRFCIPAESLSFVTPRLFASPEAAGRKIIAGFTFTQRIGKSGTSDVWFPHNHREYLESLIERGEPIGAHHFSIEWAAVRQFELLYESGNYKVFDMRSDYITRTLIDLASHMRAGGYRITVATLGSYVKPDDKDDLEILDQRLQARISRLIHMMYLEEQSDAINKAMDEALAKQNWNLELALPHIGIYLGSRDLFRPQHSDKKHILTKVLLSFINTLKSKHILHDTAVGLQLPESINENEWIYLPEMEDKLFVFNNLLSDLFRPFDRISLSRLDGRVNARTEYKSTMQHMRGYGDHMSMEYIKLYQGLKAFAM